MEKIINVKVSGSEIEQSSSFGGIQGEGGARYLKISFDEEWSAYSKSITFLDANLENPVKILLTTQNLDVDGTYLAKIPTTPLLTGGKFTYIIEGYADGILQKSVSKELKVKYAPYVDAEALEGVITPTEADQLNLSIQNEAERIDTLEEKQEALEVEITSLSESTDAKLSAKADTSYMEDALIVKADKSYVDAELSKKADTSYVEEELLAKADTSYVAEALSAKADTSHVAEELFKKADKESVAEELSKKADTSYVESALGKKADIVSVDEALLKKADKTEVENALINKADVVYVDAAITSVNKELKTLKTESEKHTDDISALDARLTNQEEYIAEKTDEMFDRNNVVANAIKGKVSGAVVQFDDVSPVEHNPTVKVRSKNLLNVDEVLSFTQIYGIDVSLKAGTYKISLSEETHEGENQPSLRFFTNDAWIVLDPNQGEKTIVLSQDESKVYLYSNGFDVFNSAEIAATVKQLMVSVDGGDYTPYVDPSTVKVTRCGKNMLINKKGDATITNIAWTVNENGTLNASGTASAGSISDYYFFGTTVENEDSFTAPCDIILSTNYETDNNNIFGARTSAGLIIGSVTSGTSSFVIPAGTRVDGVFLRAFNKTVNQQNIECQMEIGTTKTVYEPCKWQSVTPNTDGSVEGVTSLAPVMTLLTNKSGVIIETEYNKDTNKVIETLTNAIISLGGNI